MADVLDFQGDEIPTPEEEKGSALSYAFCYASNRSLWCATWPW